VTERRSFLIDLTKSTTTPATVVRRVVDPLRDFLHAEATGGLVLLAATAVALGWANSPFAGAYESLWSRELTIGIGGLAITEDLRHWISDGLMALFFFVVGLEIKRELVTGELRQPRLAGVPALAAVGGMLVPAAVFLALNAGGEGGRGWGIPVATDTAFALGILALLGSRVPATAKLFLLTLAIIDDILAITTVAVFYSADISLGWLIVAAGGLAGIFMMRRSGVASIAAYVPVGLLVWLATLESGVHATVAGVALGLATPARPVRGRPVLEQLEHRLHPVSSYLVVPLFALANAGLPLGAEALGAAATSPVSWGVALGLVAGKLIGITAASLAAVRLGIGPLPEGLGPRHVLGLAALAGIGFTVSLFITELAFPSGGLIDLAKTGILAGSLVSGVLGILLLLGRPRPGSHTASSGNGRSSGHGWQVQGPGGDGGDRRRRRRGDGGAVGAARRLSPGAGGGGPHRAPVGPPGAGCLPRPRDGGGRNRRAAPGPGRCLPDRDLARLGPAPGRALGGRRHRPAVGRPDGPAGGRRHGGGARRRLPAGPAGRDPQRGRAAAGVHRRPARRPG
jgi:NhaA family Na+:H+ antiporter